MWGLGHRVAVRSVQGRPRLLTSPNTHARAQLPAGTSGGFVFASADMPGVTDNTVSSPSRLRIRAKAAADTVLNSCANATSRLYIEQPPGEAALGASGGDGGGGTPSAPSPEVISGDDPPPAAGVRLCESRTYETTVRFGPFQGCNTPNGTFNATAHYQATVVPMYDGGLGVLDHAGASATTRTPAVLDKAVQLRVAGC